jgi:hypothetical protein
MRIPCQLLHQLAAFAIDHFCGNGLKASPSIIGEHCKEYVREWCAANWALIECSSVTVDELESLGARFGKSLSEILLSEVEV